MASPYNSSRYYSSSNYNLANNRSSVDSKLSVNTVIPSKGIKSAVSDVFMHKILRKVPSDMKLNKLYSATGAPCAGFVMPGDSEGIYTQRRASSPAASILTSQSNKSMTSRLTSKTAKSVYSIREVGRFGSTPGIVVQSPTKLGKKSYIVHRGRTVRHPAVLQKKNHKDVRYSHPSVTAVLAAPEQNDTHDRLGGFDARSFLPAFDRTERNSIISIPRTADYDKEFPGAVNVKKIARKAALDLDDAKDVVDGLNHAKIISPRSSQSTAQHGPATTNASSYLDGYQYSDVSQYAGATADIATQTEAFELPTESRKPSVVSTRTQDSHTHKQRQNALFALCGGRERDVKAGADQEQDLPACLKPRHRPLSTVTLSPKGSAFFDDREGRKSYVPASSAYVSPADKGTPPIVPAQPLQTNKPALPYVAYSPAVRLNTSTPAEETSQRKLATFANRAARSQTDTLRELYKRIEKLEFGLEEIHGGTQDALRQATRVPSMIIDATPVVYTRPTEQARIVEHPGAERAFITSAITPIDKNLKALSPGTVPQRHSMNENGFPLLMHGNNASCESLSTAAAGALGPGHQKRRVMTRQELKAMEKAERRNKAMQHPEKQRREWNRTENKITPKKASAEDICMMGRMLAKIRF